MGTGGTALKDGNDAEITRHSNCRNTPIEVFEHRYPLHTLDYRLVADSGGAGEHRGGLATQRTLRVTADEITFSALFDRCKIAPWGLAGGLPGLGSDLLVRRLGEDEFRRFDEVFGVASPTKFTNVVLRRGDELRYRTPGGGGFGDPGGGTAMRSARTSARATSAAHRPRVTMASLQRTRCDRRALRRVRPSLA